MWRVRVQRFTDHNAGLSPLVRAGPGDIAETDRQPSVTGERLEPLVKCVGLTPDIRAICGEREAAAAEINEAAGRANVADVHVLPCTVR